MIGGRNSDTCKIVYFGWVYGFDDKVNNLYKKNVINEEKSFKFQEQGCLFLYWYDKCSKS
jgi:hypothetical protein